MHLTERLINLIAPHYCLGCSAEGTLLCVDCARLLPPVAARCYRCGRPTPAFETCASCLLRTSVTQVQVGTMYDGLAKQLIHKLKYERAQSAAQDVAATLTLRDWQLPANLIVTHVPTANARVRVRGYDQARLIARHLGRQYHLPYASLLARMGSQRQVGASAKQRRAQLQNSFRVLRPHLIANAEILLIDDVLTTGATLEAAAKVLQAAGARRVRAVVFAQA